MRGRRGSRGLSGVVVVAVAALGLSGCGSGIGLSSATITTPPPIPGEITQTATRTAVPTTTTATATTTTKATTIKAARPKPAKPSKVVLRGDEQRVTVKGAGITFGAPLEFGRADADLLLTQGLKSPQLTSVATRLGLTPTELKDGLLRQTDTILVGSTVVMVMHLPAQEMPDDALLRRQFEFGSGATMQQLTHLRTKAGAAVRATYTVKAAGKTLYGDVLMIRTPVGLANVTCSAATVARSRTVMDRIVATVQSTG